MTFVWEEVDLNILKQYFDIMNDYRVRSQDHACFLIYEFDLGAFIPTALKRGGNQNDQIF